MRSLRRISVDVRVLIALMGLALLPRLPSLGQPLLERHSFRQTWTAWTAQLFHSSGIDLFRPLVPIFGPPYVLPSEFPIFQAFGAMLMWLGLATDPAMRVAGLVTFIGCAVAVWLLARDVADAATALVAVAVFVATPLALVWSRTSMIEYLALGAAVVFCWAGLRWRDGRGWRWWVVALVFGLVAAVVKPPTYVTWAIPLAVAFDRRETRTAVGWLRARLDPRLVLLGLAPLAASFAWLAYGDGIKAAQPAASFLQSSGPLWRGYYYSSLAERLDPVQIKRAWDEGTQLAMDRFALAFVFLGLVAALRIPRTSVWLAIGAAIVLPVEIFYGAYTKHDYYFVGISAQMALLAAVGFMWALRRTRTRTGRALIAAVAVASVGASLWYDAGYWTVIYNYGFDDRSVRATAKIIDDASAPNEGVIIVGLGYDPSVPYYAQRNALMLTVENLGADVVRAIPHDRYRTMYVNDPWHDAVYIARAWRWDGSLGSIYRVSDVPSGVADATLVSTDESRGADAAAAGRVLATNVRVPCGFEGADVPAGQRGTLLALRSGYPFDARLEVGHIANPVPARGWVWLSGAATPSGGTVRVICGGAAELVIDQVIDAALDLH